MFKSEKIRNICQKTLNSKDKVYLNKLAREISEEAWEYRACKVSAKSGAAICHGRLVYDSYTNTPFEQGYVPFKADSNTALRKYYNIFRGEDIVECEPGVFLVRLYEVFTDGDKATSEVLYCCDGDCAIFTDKYLESILDDGFSPCTLQGLLIHYDIGNNTLHFSKLKANDFWISNISEEEYVEFRDKLLVKMRLGKSDSIVVGNVKVTPKVKRSGGSYKVTYTFSSLDTGVKVRREYTTYDEPWSRRYYR